jgi:hypothetical protein
MVQHLSHRSIVRLILLTALVGSLVTAAPAPAAYYVGESVAEHYLRTLLHDRYGYNQTGVACQPKRGRNETYVKNGRVLYHAWLCGFYARNYGDPCKGLISLKGSDGRGGFVFYRHWSRG